MSGSHTGLRLSARDASTPGNSHEDANKPDGKVAEGNHKEDEMSDKTFTRADIDAATATAASASTKAANDRFSAVLASEHYAGRETLAQTLLGNDKMDAADIVAALAAAPAPAASADPTTTTQSQEAAEAAARRVMQDALNEQQNSDVDAGGGGGANASEESKKQMAADAVWDKANAAVGRVKKEG